jgi:hypothetical protein
MSIKIRGENTKKLQKTPSTNTIKLYLLLTKTHEIKTFNSR